MADIWCSESLRRSEWRKTNRTEWLVFTKAGLFTWASSVSSSWRKIALPEDVLVTRKRAFRPEGFSPCLAYCSSLVCIAELFANLVDGDDWPALVLNGAVFQFIGSRMFSRAWWKRYRNVAFCDCWEMGGKCCHHDSLELNNDLHVPCVWIVPIRTKITGFLFSALFDEMKKVMGENLALYPPGGMARVDWSNRCVIHQFWFHILSFEIQVTEEWSVQ